MAALNRLPNITDHDIFLLKVFDMVVKTGSFTAAEVCLNKSKSAISIYISSLESRLGRTLCRRGRGGFSLTGEGEQVYEICKALFADLDKFRDRVNCVTALMGGTLSIAIDDGLWGHRDRLVAALTSFKETSPDVFLNVYQASPDRVQSMLEDTTIDLGISAVAPEIPGVEYYPLFHEEYALYCSSEHPLFGIAEESLSAELLADYESINSGYGNDRAIEAASGILRVGGRSGKAFGRLLMILTGKVIGLLPRDFAATWISRGRLKELRVSDRTVYSQMCYVVVRKELASGEVCTRMIDHLKEVFADLGQEANEASPSIAPELLRAI